MTRPAVIIGLGGTGQWVLTYLKKDLMELNNGAMPKNVRLLSFDTVSQAEASATSASGSVKMSADQAKYEKDAKRIGDIQLDPNCELIHIGGDCWELGQEIRRGEHPHMNWFDAKYWQDEASLGRDNWILDRGAGRFRQFGLLAIYKDLLGGPVRSNILRYLPSAIRDVSADVPAETSFELILVSSVAGGTGSAMLVPLGVLAKHMFRDVLVRTRAIVVLPSAFSPGKPSAELELRGGAALRELARAMMPPRGYTAHMNFLPNSEYQDVAYTRPFDGVYFVDGTRNGQPINTDPKFGVFPAAAGWVRQILDERSGMWFSNYVSTNRAGTDPSRAAEGVFGVFGVKSFYTPVRSLQQSYRLKLANQVLRVISDPDKTTSGSLVAKALPIGATDPTIRARSILRDTAKFGNEEQVTTAYLSEVTSALQAGGAGSLDEVQKRAEAGWYSKHDAEMGVNSWVGPLTTLPAIAEFQELSHDVATELNSTFVRAMPTGGDPSSNVAFNALTTGVKEFISVHHGGMGANGPDDYGTFGVIVRRCADAQVIISRKLLRLNLMSILAEDNGRGRIGYVISVLKALDKDLKEFEVLMTAVDKKRSQMAPLADLAKEREKTASAWEKLRKTKPTLFEKLQNKPSEKAVKAEAAYRDANLKLVNYVREVTLHNAALAASRQILKNVEATRKELQRWEATLLEGDTAMDISGLLSESDQHLNQVITNIEQDVRSNEIEELVQVQNRVAQVAEEDEQWALSGIQWDAVEAGCGLEFKLRLKPDAVEHGELNVVRESMDGGQRRNINTRNLTVLEGVLEQRFGQQNKVRDIIVWCRETYTEKALAQILRDSTQPMTHVKQAARPSMEALCISLKRDNDPAGFANELEKQARVLLTGSVGPDDNHPVAVLDSFDPYRLTAIRTQVGLKLEEFATWDRCKQTYEKEITNKITRIQDEKKAGSSEGVVLDSNKQLVHALQSHYTLKAEKEAIALEVKRHESGWGHHILNPRMVSLISEANHLRMVLQAWALGWIIEVEDGIASDKFHWELRVPGWSYDVWLTPNGSKGEWDDLEVLEAFVLVGMNRSRERDNVPIVWNALSTALVEHRKPNVEGISQLRVACTKALEDGGLIALWDQKSDGHRDEGTDRMIYNNPAYHDLVDYAARYYKSL